jgi:hypothetical protein
MQTCPRCGYKERGLAINKKMIREVNDGKRNDCWYALTCIKEQSKVTQGKNGTMHLQLTPNQLEFVRACKRQNVKGLLTNEWTKFIE